MKVDGTRAPNAIKSYLKESNREKKAPKKGKKDSLSLSEEALLLQKVKELGTEPSKERQEIITRLKGQLKAGTYNVDGEDIANSILEGIFNNNSN